MEDYHRGIFIHLLFVEPLPHISPLCAPLPVFPLSPLYILPLIHIPSVCPIYTVDHLPILSPPLNFHFFCILNFTLEQVTFMKICNIIMFSFFSYASNETELKQIGQVLTEI